MAKRRRLRRILIILGAPLVLALIVILLANTAPVRRRLLALADGKLRAELGLSLEAGGSSLSLTRLAATLRDVRVSPAEPGTGPLRVLTASEIHVNLGWSTVFGGGLRVQEVRIVRPRLEALPPGEGPPPSAGPHTRPADAPAEASAGPVEPFTFEIERFTLIDGAVTVGGPARSLALSLDAIRLDLRLVGEGPDHRATLRTSGGRLALDGPPLEIRSLEADLVLDPEHVDVERILLATPLSRLAIKGRVADYQRSPSFDASLAASLSLEEASSLVAPLPAAAGSLEIDGTFKGTPASAAATVDLRADPVLIDGFPEAALRLSAESDLRALTIKELSIGSSTAGLRASGLVRLPGVEGESSLDLAWSGLDAALLSRFIAGMPPLDTVTRGEVTAAWRDHRLDTLRASGQAAFLSSDRRTETAAGVPDASAPISAAKASPLPLDGDLEFTASGDGLDIARADLRAAGAALALLGRMGWDGALDGRLEASVPDIAATVREAAVLTGPLDDLAGLSGEARLDGTIEGTTGAPILQAKLAASKLAWNTLTVDSLEASVAVDTGDGPAVDISRFRADLPAGTLEGRFALRPAAREGPGPHGPSFEASVSTTGLDLAFLEPFLPETPPSGYVAFDLEGRGPLASPTLSLRLDGWNVGAAGARIPVLELEADADGALASARLTAAPGLGLPPQLVVEAELPLAPPFEVTATLRTDGLVLDNFLVRAEGPVQPGAPGRSPQRAAAPLNAEASFFVPIEEPARSTMSLSVSDLDLGGLAAMAGAEVPPKAGGRADLYLKASGDPTRPGTLALEGEIGSLALSGDLPALETGGPVRFSLRDGTFRLDELSLAVGDSTLRASGLVRGLGAEPEIEARASLDIEASIIPPRLVEATIGGRLKLDLSVEGPAGRPEVRGKGSLAEGFVQARDFPLTLSDLAMRLELRDGALVVTDGRGLANGGLLELDGRVDLGEGLSVGRASFDAGLEGFRLNYPPGLVTISDGKARLEGDGKEWLLSGDLSILQGSFREDVFPGAELLGVSSLPLPAESGEATAAAHDFKLDIRAATVEPIVVRNNVADFALEANIRVTGSLAAPLLAGRVRNVAVGEIVFGDRTYTLETLSLEFLGQPVPDPQVNILAHTRMLHRMEDLEIQLRLTGPASDLKFNLSSTPPRSSQDLSLLLLTGRSLDEVRGSALDTLKGQMILHFTSPLLSPVTRSLERFLGIDDISFTPISIASEEDPGARLTFVKRLSDELSLTYSVDVSQTERQSWIVDYSLSRKFAVRAYKKDDGSYGGSFRHTVPLGGASDGRARRREILTGVEVETGTAEGTGLDRRLLEKAWKPLRVGRPFRVSDLGRATDNLNSLYRKRGYPNAAVTPVVRKEDGPEGSEGEDAEAPGEKTAQGTQEGRGAAGAEQAAGEARVTVVFRIEPGEPAVFDFRGDRIARKLRKKVVAGWTGKLTEKANLVAAREVISDELERKRYFRAEVKAEALAGADGGPKTYAIEVAKNGRYAVRLFEVEGNAAVDDDAIRKAASDFPLAESRGLWNLVHARRLALRSVERVYEERGYTKAEVEVLRLEEDREARVVDIALGVTEGPRSVVRRVSFEGRSAVEEKELREALEMGEGRPFDPVRAAEDRTALLNVYRGRGYQSATVKASADIVEEGGTGAAGRVSGGGAEDENAGRGRGRSRSEGKDEGQVEDMVGGGDIGISVVYRIEEGPLHKVGAIDVEGRGRTGEGFIRGASGLREGRPLTSERLAMGQKRLYDTRVFRSVNIDSQPEGAEKGEREGESVGAEERAKGGGRAADGEPAGDRVNTLGNGADGGGGEDTGAGAGTGAGPGDDEHGDVVRERVLIEVRETPPVTLSYGLRYNSEEKIEGFGEVDLRSPFGQGLIGLLAFRRNARETDVRFSVESNYLFGVRFNLLSTVYTNRRVRDLFTADETGVTLQSRLELPSRFNLSALYRMNRIHTYDPAAPGSAIEENVFVSEISALLLRDTRDDLLDPRSGSFLSVTATWSPEFLATELPYVSVFGQYQNYLEFGPGLVWAAAGRVGAADAFGRDLVAAKRFFAGGGNSVRGFVQDGIGPVDPLLGVPAGGAVVVVVNQELRFPIFGPASGAVFYDLGAVYPTLRDVRLGDVRHGVGAGLRVRSPVGLVRADYGFNLWPRAGEKRAVFYLSIGQAF